jgi:hypothetical protein
MADKKNYLGTALDTRPHSSSHSPPTGISEGTITVSCDPFLSVKSKKSSKRSYSPQVSRFSDKENVRYAVCWPTCGETRIFILYKNNKLESISHKKGNPDVLFQQTELCESGLEKLSGLVRIRDIYKYLNSELKRQKQQNTVNSRYIPEADFLNKYRF